MAQRSSRNTAELGVPFDPANVAKPPLTEPGFWDPSALPALGGEAGWPTVPGHSHQDLGVGSFGLGDGDFGDPHHWGGLGLVSSEQWEWSGKSFRDKEGGLHRIFVVTTFSEFETPAGAPNKVVSDKRTVEVVTTGRAGEKAESIEEYDARTVKPRIGYELAFGTTARGLTEEEVARAEALVGAAKKTEDPTRDPALTRGHVLRFWERRSAFFPSHKSDGPLAEAGVVGGGPAVATDPWSESGYRAVPGQSASVAFAYHRPASDDPGMTPK